MRYEPLTPQIVEQATPEQIKSLVRICVRNNTSIDVALKAATPEIAGTALMVPVPGCGWFGIERDGHAHT